MIKFSHTAAAEAFIATADNRETSVEIMRAIAAFAADEQEAEQIWQDGLTNWDDTSKFHFVATVTGDCQWGEPSDYCWGAAGSNWAADL